jgi:hypothetical protein
MLQRGLSPRWSRSLYKQIPDIIHRDDGGLVQDVISRTRPGIFLWSVRQIPLLLAGIMVNVFHFLRKKILREDVAGVEAILPYFVFLTVILIQALQYPQLFCEFLRHELTDDLSRRVTLEIAHDSRKGMFPAELANQVDMVWHDHKNEQLHPPASAEKVQTVQNNADDGFALEDVDMPYRRGRDEVQIIRVKVRADWHVTSSSSFGGLAPERAVALLQPLPLRQQTIHLGLDAFVFLRELDHFASIGGGIFELSADFA